MAKRKNGTGIILKYKQYFIVRLYAFIFFLLVLVSLGFILLSGNVCGWSKLKIMLHVVGRQTRQFKYIFLQEVKEISAVTSSKLRVWYFDRACFTGFIWPYERYIHSISLLRGTTCYSCGTEGVLVLWLPSDNVHVAGWELQRWSLMNIPRNKKTAKPVSQLHRRRYFMCSAKKHDVLDCASAFSFFVLPGRGSYAVATGWPSHGSREV